MPVAPDLRGSALDGRYELHELIGEGAFGCVYRGRDRRLERAVAIKVIKPWWAQDPAWVAQFEREARLLARVSHPGIVQIYDIGHGDDGLYYVSELVDGESLGARLERGPLACAEAISVAAQLCLALEHAHERGIVHRDVKPANILLARGGTVKLGDFGVARLAEGSSDGATVAGTPRYMAPEQARGRAVSAASDVYSVGVVLYEMLAGAPPFCGGSAVDLALRHLTEPVAPLAVCDVPAELERVVMRALAKEPTQRFATAGEMARALARARRAADGGDTLALAPAAEGRSTRRRMAPTRDAAPQRGKVTGRRSASGPIGAALSLIACAGALGALAGAILAGTRIVAVPALRGLGRETALVRLHRLGLVAEPVARYSERVARGEVISQSPAPGRRIERDSRVVLVLSQGPPPIAIPSLQGQSGSLAASRLRRDGVHARLVTVPAPGATEGDVVAQRPAAGASVPAGSTVVLSVAQAPRWRYLTSLSAGGSRQVPLRILGRRFRLVYSMRYQQSCTFLLFSFCSAPTARVRDLNLGGGATVARFALRPGSSIVQTFDAGPGEFELQVSPGGTPSNWQITVEDYY
jgi:hypothetical protein